MNENENLLKRPPDTNDANGVKVETNSSQPPSKKFRSNEELDIRFLVSSKEAGAIIGKGGANINHLRKHYKSSVTVPDCPGPERVLSIVSSIDTLGDILKDVIGYIDDRSKDNPDHEVELRLLIHTSHAGVIIGKGGQRIKDLREQTKAAIKVFSQCCPMSTERICAIQGSGRVVIDAIKTVLDIILATPPKGIVKLYDPYNFDIYGAPDYGGYTEPAPSGAFRNRTGSSGVPYGSARGASRMPRRNNGSRGGAAPGTHWQHDIPSMIPPPDSPWATNLSPRVTSYNNPPERPRGAPLPQGQMYSNRWQSTDERPISLQSTQNLHPPNDQPPYWSDVIPNIDNQPAVQSHQGHSWTSAYRTVGSGGEQIGPNGDEHNLNIVTNPDGSTSATITVPHSVAGAIIGKGGNRIRNVRQNSGADISIESAQGPGKDRIITIKGTQQQVHYAHSLLRKSISCHFFIWKTSDFVVLHVSNKKSLSSDGE